jgi:hypothetical protein
MRQVRTHTWAPDTYPKLKYLQDLSISVNPEVTEEVMHHAGLRVEASPFARVQIHPSVARVIQSLPPHAQPGQLHNRRTAPKKHNS